MANLSYLSIGVPASGRLVFRNIHDQPAQGGGVTPLPESDGGGPSSPLRDWRWYDGQELRPNWYDYPEERKSLRKAIARASKAKVKLNKKLRDEPQRIDVPGVVTQLQALEATLSHLFTNYAQMVSARQESEEDSELLELIELGVLDG